MKNIHFWFQNLNENKQKLFHFRGDFSKKNNFKSLLKFELCSGSSFKLKYCHDSDNGPSIILGLFFFTAYLSSNIFKLPFFNYNKEYGFYLSDWSFVWSWNKDMWSWNSKTPWYNQFYFRIDDFFLGQFEVVETHLGESENIKFEINNKPFLMNSIKYKKVRRFRRNIPFSLYHDTWINVNMTIDNPPMRSGKGENSWDCDDDGSFGMSMPWKHSEIPNFSNLEKCNELAVKDYVNSALKDAKRYGSGSGPRGIKSTDQFAYIGRAK